MKDKLITTITVLLFLLTLIFGSALLLGVMLIIIPMALLQCLFNTNPKNENESI
jgi:hypothetical protein